MLMLELVIEKRCNEVTSESKHIPSNDLFLRSILNNFIGVYLDEYDSRFTFA